jgi:hypothetical protein
MEWETAEINKGLGFLPLQIQGEQICQKKQHADLPVTLRHPLSPSRI